MIRHTRLIRLLVVLLVLIGLGSYLSLFLGVTTIDPLDALKEWTSGNLSKDTLVLTTLRLPRLVLGLLLGANLAVAGALMQAVTRNPLASPQVFGVNAGASLFVVLALLLFPALGTANLVYFAFFGALIGGLLVFSFASVRGMTSLKLALVGMAIHLLLTSLTKGLILFNDRITNVLYWLSGSISDSGWIEVRLILPWSIIGLILAFSLAQVAGDFSTRSGRSRRTGAEHHPDPNAGSRCRRPACRGDGRGRRGNRLHRSDGSAYRSAAGRRGLPLCLTDFGVIRGCVIDICRCPRAVHRLSV